MNHKLAGRGFAASLLALSLLPAAYAGGVHDIPLTSIPLARTPIVVDGDLGDWPDTRATKFVPIDAGLAKSGEAALARLRGYGDSASLQVCYDSKALYFGVVWSGLKRAAGDSSITFHIHSDRTAHVLIGPITPGRQSVIKERFDDQATWRGINGDGAKCAITESAGGIETQEVRIPWSDITKDGAPSSRLILAADLKWPNLTQSFIRQLPTDVLHANTHLTACFLTSPAMLFQRSAYLGDPSEWGDLKFADGPQANTTQVSTLATGATVSYVNRLSGPIDVDADLSAWSPAAFQSVVYAPGLIGDRYSAKIASAYDTNYLYIAAHVQSPGGPLNTEAEATQAGYAGGDCLQIRLNDGKNTVNLCGWYDSRSKTPALTADGSDLKNPFLLKLGGKEAFHIDADGEGYTQEIAIPWSVLPSGTAPKAGDTWKASFQVWWSGLSPEFTAIADPTLAQGGGIAYSYRLPVESDVTLGVYDSEGHLIDTLIKDAHRRSGSNTEYWDGKDQFGKPVTAGKYVVRGLYHSPLEVKYALSVGNPGTPPWPTPDGKGDWLSDEAAPQGAVTDGTNVYLAAPGCEKGSSIIAVGPDGKRIWGFSEGVNPRSVTLALSGSYLYALFSGPETVHPSAATNGADKIGRAYIVCLDKTTGETARFSTQKSDFLVATWPYVDRCAGLWDLRANKTFSPENYGGQTRYFANDIGEPTDAIGIAALGGRIYVSMLTENQILVLDEATGKQIDTISVPLPAGLCALPSGALLAISNGKVVSIDPKSKQLNTVIDHDLAAPDQVTTDSAGRIYVSDWGASFQVKIFSPEGKLLRAVGTKGGRPWTGKWDADGMLLPRGIAVTNDGKLWVAEDDASPNRVSVWDAATGDFLRDYIGPTPYGGGGTFWADPKDPTIVMGSGAFFKLDYAKKTWTPISTAYRRMSLNEPFTPNGMAGQPGGATVTHDGIQYVYINDGSYQMDIMRRDGDQLKPVAAFGCLGRNITNDGTGRSIWDSDIGTHMIQNYYPAFFKGHKGDNYVWIDKNGDGEVEPDEIQWAHTLSRGDKYVPGVLPEIIGGWGFGVAKDGTIYLNGFCGDRNVVSRLAIQGWTSNGAPLYTLAAAQPVVLDPADNGVEGLFVDSSNHLLITRPYEWSHPSHALDCYDASGAPLWSIAAPAGKQQDDDFQADNVIGEFQEPGGERILASWLWHGNFKPYLVTSDGLFVGSILDDGKLGPTSSWDESYKNYFQAPDGSAYIVDGANDAYHIDKILGLDQLHRFSGAISVTDADLKSAANAAARIAALPAALPKPIVHVTWMQTPPTIDGSLDEWASDSSVTLNGSKGRSARIALGRDQSNLYLAYDVHGAKLVNRGGDWQRLFISGDCDDLMLHVGVFKPHFTPAEGDERLLLSVYQGQPIAVLYRPVVPGTTSSTRMLGATIDQIVRLTSAKIAYKRSGDDYTLEASIPLSDLGIDPTETDTLRGDVGVIYADETGADRALRLYYYNPDTEMVADLTTEATLQPGNWGDIELPLGPNLLKNGDFEEPLTASPNDGWSTGSSKNGGAASISDDVSYTGSHSLLLQDTAPVVFTADAFNLPSYDEFIKSANGGAGGGYVEVRQRVAVTGGKSYNLRFHIHTVDFPGGENRQPGPKRGYVSLESWLNFEGASGGAWVLNYQDSTPDWVSLFDPRANYYTIPVSFKAPVGATAAVLQFSLAANAAGHLPKAYVDDVEWAEAQ